MILFEAGWFYSITIFGELFYAEVSLTVIASS